MVEGPGINLNIIEMEELAIKHGMFIVVRRVIGVINILCASFWLIAQIGSLRFFDWIFFISFMISGGSLLTNGFGTEKSFIQAGEGFLKIKWMNRIRSVIIQNAEIEKITLTRFKAIIESKERKPLKLNLDFLERDQKKEVYEYLIEYAKTRNLDLVKEFS